MSKLHPMFHSGDNWLGALLMSSPLSAGKRPVLRVLTGPDSHSASRMQIII